MSPENGTDNSEKALSRAPKRRRPGRPAGAGNKQDKRELLLDTALRLFSSQSIAQTPLSAIAAAAGVTTAMLHYYFKTREQLIDVIIDERYLPVRASMGGVFERYPDDPVQALTALTQKFIDVSLENPWFAPMWIRETVSGSGLLKQRIDERFGREQKEKALLWIQKWQQEGRLNPDLQPELLFISLFGLTLLPIGKIQQSEAAGEHSLTAELLSKHVAALLKSGVGNGPQK
ncbi:MAG TPA: TetR/AcrR family transcriptional regulator [Buttiauxella sp.]|jgi:AcrR family transcriptional regulator